ncbi:MAG: biopolymer transporter ExbD [Cyclobacteriaceae bacterium]
MIRFKKRENDQEINTGSMADIAFLLLIFFLVATTLQFDKGLTLKLPPNPEEKEITVPIKERNLFKILINSNQHILVEGEVRQDLLGLKDEIKTFVLNNGRDEKLSENPEKAIVSLKTNRGTKYKSFIKVLDELKGAYYEIYAEKVGLSKEDYLKLRHSNREEYNIYKQSKQGIPMNISIAEPTI